MTAPAGIAGEDPARVLDELPAFRAMPEDVRRLVADAFEPVAYDFGNVIVREGDEADAFYVLVSGTARVVKHAGGADEVSLNVLRRGDSFGEIGLLGRVHAASRPCARAGRSRRCASTAASSARSTRRHPEVRAEFERAGANRTARNFLRLHSSFAALPDDGLALLADAARAGRGQSSDDVVIREGDPPGPMYVVERGPAARVRRAGRDARRTSSTSARATSSASARSSWTSRGRRPSRR